MCVAWGSFHAASYQPRTPFHAIEAVKPLVPVASMRHTSALPYNLFPSANSLPSSTPPPWIRRLSNSVGVDRFTGLPIWQTFVVNIWLVKEPRMVSAQKNVTRCVLPNYVTESVNYPPLLLAYRRYSSHLWAPLNSFNSLDLNSNSLNPWTQTLWI